MISYWLIYFQTISKKETKMKVFTVLIISLFAVSSYADSFGGGIPRRPSCSRLNVKLVCATDKKDIYVKLSHKRNEVPELDKDLKYGVCAVKKKDVLKSLKVAVYKNDAFLDAIVANTFALLGSIKFDVNAGYEHFFKAQKDSYLINAVDIKTDPINDRAEGTVSFLSLSEENMVLKIDPLSCK